MTEPVLLAKPNHVHALKRPRQSDRSYYYFRSCQSSGVDRRSRETAIAAAEVGLTAVALRGGWFLEKVRAWAYFLRPSAWAEVRRGWNYQRTIRRVPDSEIARFMSAEVKGSPVPALNASRTLRCASRGESSGGRSEADLDAQYTRRDSRVGTVNLAHTCANRYHVRRGLPQSSAAESAVGSLATWRGGQ